MMMVVAEMLSIPYTQITNTLHKKGNRLLLSVSLCKQNGDKVTKHLLTATGTL